MSGRLAQLLAHPIAERDRQRAFVAVAVIMLLAAGALTLIAPAHGPKPIRVSARSAPAAVSPAPPTAMPSVPIGPPPTVLQVGRAFLSDYLAYLYGHTRGRTFHAASASLARSLASHPARVSPAMRRRHPRVVSLTGHQLPGRSRWVLTATIADGGVARYPIELLIASSSRGPLVVGLGED
jgi:hypothetical protein